MGWFFVFFFISGFCSILYEIVWLRLAMAQFGVTSALVSIVLSMFMAGLGLGSWGSGYLIRKYGNRHPDLPATALCPDRTSDWDFGNCWCLCSCCGDGTFWNVVPISSSWAYYLVSGSGLR